MRESVFGCYSGLVGSSDLPTSIGTEIEGFCWVDTGAPPAIALCAGDSDGCVDGGIPATAELPGAGGCEELDSREVLGAKVLGSESTEEAAIAELVGLIDVLDIERLEDKVGTAEV